MNNTRFNEAERAAIMLHSATTSPAGCLTAPRWACAENLRSIEGNSDIKPKKTYHSHADLYKLATVRKTWDYIDLQR